MRSALLLALGRLAFGQTASVLGQSAWARWRQSRRIMSASRPWYLEKQMAAPLVVSRAASLGQEEPHGHAARPQRKTSKEAPARSAAAHQQRPQHE